MVKRTSAHKIGSTAPQSPIVAENARSMQRALDRFSEAESRLRREIEVLDWMLTTVIDRPIPPRIPTLPGDNNPQNLDPDPPVRRVFEPK